MIDTDLFQNSNLLWPVVSVSFILWMLFVWKEWGKPLKNRFYINSLVALITVLSFAMLALKPLSTDAAHTNVGVVLTNGFNQNRLDSLKKKLKRIKVIHYKKNLPIDEVLDSLGSFFVLGNGIETYDFWQFRNRSVAYLGAAVPNGIIALKDAQKNTLGEDLKIRGKYHKAQPSNSLVLRDGNGRGLDSTILDAEVQQNFELSTILKAKGKFVYEMVEKDSHGEIISSESLPFKVISNTNLKILLVNGFPTFETKYLKNYLAEMGHDVVVRSQLTRGRYKFEYFNTKQTPIYRLGKQELENFDLLVVDGNSFRSLSESSWTSIEEAVRNNGLGLFVQPEPKLFGRPSERLGLAFERDGVSTIAWNEFQNLALEKYPFQFKDSNRLEEIHSSNRSPIAAYKRREKGRIGASLVQSTYQLQLDGKAEAYRRFWSGILNRLTKKEELTSEWNVRDKFPLENHPFDFELRTTIEKPLVVTENGSSVPLLQSIDIPTLWSGTDYPTHQGWNELRLEAESQAVLDFYVFDSLAWQPLRTHVLQKENRRYFAGSTEEFKKRVSIVPIKPLWFFLLGLLGLGYLWLHPKLFRQLAND